MFQGTYGYPVGNKGLKLNLKKKIQGQRRALELIIHNGEF